MAGALVLARTTGWGLPCNIVPARRVVNEVTSVYVRPPSPKKIERQARPTLDLYSTTAVSVL